MEARQRSIAFHLCLTSLKAVTKGGSGVHLLRAIAFSTSAAATTRIEENRYMTISLITFCANLSTRCSERRQRPGAYLLRGAEAAATEC